MKAVVILYAVFTVLCASGMEWTFAPGETEKVVPHDPALDFPDGFKATFRFSCDLDKIGRSDFANLAMKGSDFHNGWNFMVRKNGQLLVDLLGVKPQYHIVDMKIEANREYLLEAYVLKEGVRLFLDGEERGSYEFTGGARDMRGGTAPLKLGSAPSYPFFGTMKSVKLEPLADVKLPPGVFPKPFVLMPPINQARAEIQWVRPICAPEERYIGWPTVCRLKNGEIIAAFSGDREEHVCPWGKVQIARSKDDGETWEGPVTIQNGPLDDRDAGIVQMPDGDILITWFTSDYYRRSFNNNVTGELTPDQPLYWWKRHDEKIPPEVARDALGYFRTLSQDNGKTWSKPMRMTGVGSAPHGPVLLRDGSLFQVGITGITRKTPDGEKRCTAVGAWKSIDKGATWQCLCPDIPWSDDEGLKNMALDEPHVVELADGTLVGMIRFNGADQYLRQTVSTDGGKTWTRIVKTPMVGLPPHLIRLEDNKLVCVYARRMWDQWGQYACLSDDNGKTWDVANEIKLANGFQVDLGYPSTCVLGDGSLLTVYYQQPEKKSKCALMATKWKVKGLRVE